jgi:hypothetical protein
VVDPADTVVPPLGCRNFGISTIIDWPGAVQPWSQQRPGWRFFVMTRVSSCSTPR